MSSFAGRTFRPFKVGLNTIGGKSGVARTKVQTVGAAKKIIAGTTQVLPPKPPMKTSKRITIKPVQSFGKKKYK